MCEDNILIYLASRMTVSEIDDYFCTSSHNTVFVCVTFAINWWNLLCRFIWPCKLKMNFLDKKKVKYFFVGCGLSYLPKAHFESGKALFYCAANLTMATSNRHKDH